MAIQPLNQPTYDKYVNPYASATAPTVTPVAPAPVVPSAPAPIASTKLNPVSPDLKAIPNQKQLGIDRLNTFFTGPSFDQSILGKDANTAFLNAISLATTGKVDPNIMSYKGTVSDALNKYGLGNLAPNMGMKSDYAEAAAAPASTTATTSPEMDKVSSAYQQVIDMYKERLGESGKTEEYSIAKKTELDAANKDVEKARQMIADKELLDAQTLKNYENRVIPMGEIQKQQSRFTADEYMTNLVNTQDYNNKLILAKMAEGNYLEAQKMTQEAADTQADIAKLQIDKAMDENKITEAEKDRMDKDVEYQRELALKGYTYLDGKNYAKAVKDYGVTPETFGQFFYKDVNGKVYLKPAGEANLESFTDDQGFVHFIDKNTGKEVSRSATAVGKTKTQAPSVTLIQQGEQSADLSAAVGRLNTGALGQDGKYDSQKVLNEAIEWDIAHPERQGALLNAVKNRLNTSEPLGKQLYTGKVNTTSGTVKLTNPNGVTIEINK